MWKYDALHTLASGHMLVKHQLPIENDAKAFDGGRRLNSSMRNPERGHAIDSILSATDCELHRFHLTWVQLQSILLQPRMNASDAVLELSDFDCLFISAHSDVYLGVICLLMMINTERRDNAG